MAVNIPHDVRARVDDYYLRRMLPERFGDTPPTPDQEKAFIRELLDGGLVTIPLMGNMVARVISDGSVSFEDEAPAVSAATGQTGRSWHFILGVVLLLVALAGIGVMVLESRPSASAKKPGETPGPLATLPAGIDALVTSGDVKVPLVVPRTLEIAVNGIQTTTTFVVVPVAMKEADWTCPIDEMEGQPAACWLLGTVVNYLIGIPYSANVLNLIEQIEQNGGVLRLRLSTERVLTFQLAVREVARHETEVLSQQHCGLTLVALGQPGLTRKVVIGSYDSTPDIGDGNVVGQAMGGQPGPDSGRTTVSVGLGQSIVLGDIEISPVESICASAASQLTIQVNNRGSVPFVVADWGCVALLKDGTTVTARTLTDASVAPNASAQIQCFALGEAVAWKIATGGQDVMIALP